MKTFRAKTWKRVGSLAIATLLSSACNGTPAARADQNGHMVAEDRPSERAMNISAEPAAASTPTRKRNLQEGYPWFDGTTQNIPQPESTLEERFPTEPGFQRVKLDQESFGYFLRSLPLAAHNTPVLSYRGDTIRTGNHPHVAAVVSIDVGNADLQQCADAVIRLHAEWRYARGHRDHEYKAASGTKLSFGRYAAGSRAQFDGKSLKFVLGSTRKETTHSLLRSWLDEVFEWTNTGALARDGQKVKFAEVRPGDFFVLTGVPFGHAVLVLDVAEDARGRKAFLLGQSFVPAQNFHVLRPNASTAWFVVEPSAGSVQTPFWDPFPFESLRRLPE